MDFKVVIDWKSLAVLGGTLIASILVTRLDDEAVESVTTQIVEAVKEYAIVTKGNR